MTRYTVCLRNRTCTQVNIIHLFSVAVFQDLLGTTTLDGAQSFESLNEEDADTTAGSSQPLPPSPKPRRLLPTPPQARKRAPRTPSPTRKLPQIPTVRKSVDDIDVGRKVGV